MKHLFLIMFLALALCAQVGPTTVADLTGDGSAHTVSSATLLTRSVDLTALAGNSGTCRVGDSSISSTRGQPIAAGGSYHYQLSNNRAATGKDQYVDLHLVYYLCGSGDKLAVHYVQ